MLRNLSIAALALAALPSLAEAQQYSQPAGQPMSHPPGHAMPAQPQVQAQPMQGQPMQGQTMQRQAGPVDASGRPYVMSPPQPSPGDPGYGRGMATPAQAPMSTQSASMPSQAMAPSDAGGTMRDEYGNLYNSRGDRVDRKGRILPPPVTPPGARALR
jgi:hypothetical protein